MVNFESEVSIKPKLHANDSQIENIHCGLTRCNTGFPFLVEGAYK